MIDDAPATIRRLPHPIGLFNNCYTNWKIFLLTAKCKKILIRHWAKFDSSIVKRRDYA